MKIKYKLRNFFFPRKHSNVIREIRVHQKFNRLINKEIEYYNELMECGVLGDTLLDNYHKLVKSKEYHLRRIEELKKSI